MSQQSSQLLHVLQEYRQQLQQQDTQALAHLSLAHQQVLQSLQPALDKLYGQIADKQQEQDEAVIPPSWLYEQNRLQTIKALIAQQVGQFGHLAQSVVAQLQRSGAQLGMKAAEALLQSTIPTGVRWTFGLPSLKAIADMVGATRPGSPLAALFASFGREAADAAAKALILGVSLGTNPRAMARDVSQALEIPRARALTIARTEMVRAYRGANLETYRANEDVVEQWRWTCDKSARTCIACLVMDGSLHPLGEEMGSHPNCRCTPVPVTKNWEDILGPLGIDTSSLGDARPQIQSGRDWLQEQSEATQRAVLGNKYQGWSQGDFSLQDLVGHSHDDQWGHSIYEKPLKAVIAS